jgi:hypothetical protein
VMGCTATGQTLSESLALLGPRALNQIVRLASKCRAACL